MPHQLRRVRLSLPKPFKTRWSTRSGQKSPALVSPVSVGAGSLDPKCDDDDDNDNEQNSFPTLRATSEGKGADEDDRMDMGIETITPMECLESRSSWNDKAPQAVAIESETENSDDEVPMVEETFSTTTSIATTEDETTVDTAKGTAIVNNASDLDDANDAMSFAQQSNLGADGDAKTPTATTPIGVTIVDHVFEEGDRVQVMKGHTKFGMSGDIYKKTKAYVFFIDEETKKKVQIKPQSLVLVVGNAPSRDHDEVGKQQQQHQQEPPLPVISSPSFDTDRRHPSNPLILEPKDFSIGSTVVVHSSHQKHAGKVGTVKDHTKCFVRISFSANDKEGVLVQPKFLVLNAGDNQSISTSQSFATSFSDRTDGNGTPQDDMDSVEACEGIASFNFRKYVVKKISLGLKTPSTCAFEAIWDKGNSLPPLEMPLTDLPLKRRVGDKEYELYFADVGEDASGYSKFKRKNVTAFYVCSENLREHEELLADFGALPAHKVWARRKLLFSPAMKVKNKHAIYPINANVLTMVDDLGTAGCGFISEHYLEYLLGNNKAARVALGIQVRIFVPTVGIYKGVLMRRRNMQVPIELNDSLLKVGPSRRPNASDDGWIVITSSFPSAGNYTFARVFKNKKDHQNWTPLSKLSSFNKEVKREQSFKMSPMYLKVIESLGVPDTTIESYRNEYKRNPEKIQHTHLVGMADPTDLLPPNSVFVTGIRGVEIKKLFVTRSPCMESKDGRVLRVVTAKPDSMAIDDWEWLQNLSFGALIYAYPETGDRPLPELIADGDLDGDLYFVCWNESILDHMKSIPITDDDLAAPLDTQTKTKQYDPDWFVKTQRFIAEAPTHHAGIDELVGKFHNLWKAIADINDANAISFARACKRALDLKTHGGRIYLPGHLWDKVPKRLHHYLTVYSDEE